ncbi:single-stranded DNA-binding protein [Streptomyces sioyaensis]|uniref:single-stranded DNA-binding protein n=1 Tax=Streptomyces sioyaensis TaxID=67364 RepID=UPI002285B6B3|nr:single-stranded DNA-binding protein [Streptomyces sioyaensis]
MVTLVGNAATAVEHRQTTAGATVARFRLAATSRRWDKALERWTDGETSFYTVRSWRGLADNVAASVAVGEPLIVQGRLRLREGEQSPERGGQRWFSAEVDAVAIGHDLARGTAAFRRVVRTARTGMDSTAPSSPQPSQPPAQSSGSAHAAQPQGSPEAEAAPASPPVAPAAGGSRKVPVPPAASDRPSAAAKRSRAAGTPARAGAPQAVESSTIPPVPPPVEPRDPSLAPAAAGADSPEKVAVS